jgi:hypothetical protein
VAVNGLHVTYRVDGVVLEETRSFLRERGLHGCEGMALWIGAPAGDGLVRVTRVLVPEQVCHKTPDGVYVEMTERAHLTLPNALHGDERFCVRVHSHPGRAYHSARDDANRVLTHQGALSVVVPDFARRPLSLPDCAVYRLRHGAGWEALCAADIARTFEVQP